MSEQDESKPGGPADDRAPEGFEDTVVEILSLGDEDDDAADRDDPPVDAVAVKRLEMEVAAERERILRLRADFDNFRKRAERERAEIERFALADLLRDLLPVVDNLERALAVPEPSSGGEGSDLRRGVEMIARQFQELLKRNGLVPIPALGERFDPSVHEAVLREESDAVEHPMVAAELQRGYRLNDRLLRPSLVKVAVPAEPAHEESTEQTP